MEHVGELISNFDKERVAVGVEKDGIILSVDHGCDGEEAKLSKQDKEKIVEVAKELSLLAKRIIDN